MPAKKNTETGGENSPVETKHDPPSVKYVDLQTERRKLEAELDSINAQIKSAITAGDAKTMARLTARKADLPRLFIEASMAETSARQDIFAETDAENVDRLNKAEEARNAILVDIAAKKAAFEKEMGALNDKLNLAEANLNGVQASVNAARNVAADANVAFDRSLAKLAGV